MRLGFNGLAKPHGRLPKPHGRKPNGSIISGMEQPKGKEAAWKVSHSTHGLINTVDLNQKIKLISRNQSKN